MANDTPMTTAKTNDGRTSATINGKPFTLLAAHHDWRADGHGKSLRCGIVACGPVIPRGESTTADSSAACGFSHKPG